MPISSFGPRSTGFIPSTPTSAILHGLDRIRDLDQLAGGGGRSA
jgi:hypothetical protein